MLRVGALVLAFGSVGAATFSHSFSDGLAPFTLSTDAKYEGQPVTVQDGLLLEAANQHYGIAAPISVASKGDLVVQYEVTLTDGLTCGGAYVKLLTATDSLNVAAFDDKTGYAIMFGPDKCGATDKVHFILRQQNAVSKEWFEHHLSQPVRVINDKKPHLYTAVIKSDDSVEVLIDGESKFAGSLTEDFDPPLQPSVEIDDPDDSKPLDWVEDPQMEDSEASKPDDWDEAAPKKIDDPDAVKPEGWMDAEPATVPDPAAEMPADWDEEEDGEWEAPEVDNPLCSAGCGEWHRPVVDNPEYKGKWVRPMVSNPAYKGVWAPRSVPNPNYFLVESPSTKLPALGALAVEIWTTNKGITFDNFLVSTDVETMQAPLKAFADARDAQLKVDEEKKADKKLKKLAEKSKQGGLKGLSGKIQTLIAPLLVKLEPLMDLAAEQPAAAAGTGFVVLITLMFLLVGGKKKTKPAAAPPPAAEEEKNEPADDDDEDEEEEDEK